MEGVDSEKRSSALELQRRQLPDTDSRRFRDWLSRKHKCSPPMPAGTVPRFGAYLCSREESMNYRIPLGITALAVPFAITSGTVAAQDAAHYYAGQTINMIVGRDAGSGADTTARAFARHLAKHIPGNPSIVVRNMGGTASWNYMANVAAPDGLTISMTPYQPASQVMGDDAFEADFTKMEFVASFYNPPLVIVRSDVVSEPLELLDAEPGMIYAGNNPVGRFDIFGRMTLDMLDVDYRYITGLGGAGAVVDSLQRGETHIGTIGLNIYKLRVEEQMVEPGEMIPLYYFPWPGHTGIASEIFGDIPSFEDYYEAVHGEQPSGEVYDMFVWMGTVLNSMAYSAFLPEGTDPELRDILREAADATAADPELHAEMEAMFGFRLPYIDAELADEILSALAATTPERAQFISEFIDSAPSN